MHDSLKNYCFSHSLNINVLEPVIGNWDLIMPIMGALWVLENHQNVPILHFIIKTAGIMQSYTYNCGKCLHMLCHNLMSELFYFGFILDFNAPYLPQCNPQIQSTWLEGFMCQQASSLHQLKWLHLVHYGAMAIKMAKVTFFAHVWLFTKSGLFCAITLNPLYVLLCYLHILHRCIRENDY